MRLWGIIQIEPTIQEITMKRRTDLVKSSIDSLLLCLISREPMYGYQVIKELEGRSQGYFKFKEGTLYPALHRLEKSGLVLSKWQILPTGQHRKYYYITDKGCASMAEKMTNWQDFLNAMNLIMQGQNPQPTS
jgi:PadR family transcriptional regulator, regulatory protein PadR